MTSNNYFVYIVECSDKTYYVGKSRNIKKRIQQHNGELRGGAKYTKGRRPVTLRWYQQVANNSCALKEEYKLKQLSRSQKKILIANFLLRKN